VDREPTLPGAGCARENIVARRSTAAVAWSAVPAPGRVARNEPLGSMTRTGPYHTVDSRAAARTIVARPAARVTWCGPPTP